MRRSFRQLFRYEDTLAEGLAADLNQRPTGIKVRGAGGSKDALNKPTLLLTQKKHGWTLSIALSPSITTNYPYFLLPLFA